MAYGFVRIPVALIWVAIAGYAAVPAAGEPDEDAPATQQSARAAFIADVCARIEKAAKERRLPPAFFARLIWKESRFDPEAVSPKGAAGIAQFMPGTARLRGLDDPFDPRVALPASAHYLSDLRDEFGNLGLAAAAYNAGPQRVRNWRAGRGGLPAETRDFVRSITGHGAHDWNRTEPPEAEFALNREMPFQEACRAMPVRRMKPPVAQYASAQWKPWGVHLTADWSPTRALSFYTDIQREFPSMLGGVSPMVLRVVNYSWGRAPRFEVRVGKETRTDANEFCRALKRAGGKCIVLRTPRQ